jgi:plasmid stabilization system protein ParE
VSPLPVTVTARARADLDEIHDWYRAIRPELAQRFDDAVDVVMAAIAERPDSFPEVEEGVRRALCRTFPYKVYFVVNAEEVRVQAVYHVRRDPRKWDLR